MVSGRVDPRVAIDKKKSFGRDQLDASASIRVSVGFYRHLLMFQLSHFASVSAPLYF